MNIYALLDEFCHHKKYLRGVTEATLKRYRSIIGYFISNSDIKYIQDVSRKSLQEFFLYGSIQRNWKPATYRTHHITLHSFLKWCVNEHYLHVNYMENIESPTLHKNLPKALSKKQAKRIIDTVQSYSFESHFLRVRNHLIFSFFLYTGIRKSELLNIMMHHVDIEKRQLSIIQGKGRKDRIIPLNHVLIPLFEKYLYLRRRKRIIIPELFVSKQSNKAFTESGLRRLISIINHASGVAFSCHTLRHTFATIMLESSCDIYTLSKILGHNDIKTTTIYLALQDNYLRGHIENYRIR